MDHQNMNHQNADRSRSHLPSRRDFLTTGALSALGLGVGGFTRTANGHTRTNPEAIAAPGQAKNIIFLVSDGMSTGTLTMADLHLRRHHDRRSHWIRLYEDGGVRRGLMDMAAANSIVTGSAAGSSAWGSGHRVNNESVNIGPNGEEHQPILAIFRDAGKSTGLVTTTRITHATPAGFGINMSSRWMEDDIAAQYLEREYDVLMGGGRRHFVPEGREDGRNLLDGFRSKNYAVAESKADLADWNRSGRFLGTFFDTHLPYVLDQRNTPEHRARVPRLPEMTEAALERLDKNRGGFILQVEGGRVDHGAHDADTGGLVYDQVEFDDAIGTVLSFAEGRDDTLVIMTTDHGNANPAVNAAGDRYEASSRMFDRVAGFKYTNGWVLAELGEDSTVREIRDRVETAWQFSIEPEDAKFVQSALRGNRQAAYRKENGPDITLASVQANYTSINWLGTDHTSDYVELAALGPGSEAIGSFTRNTDLFDVMVTAAGVQPERTQG
jgi:alkaline phosphatase